MYSTCSPVGDYATPGSRFLFSVSWCKLLCPCRACCCHLQVTSRFRRANIWRTLAQPSFGQVVVTLRTGDDLPWYKYWQVSQLQISGVLWHSQVLVRLLSLWEQGRTSCDINTDKSGMWQQCNHSNCDKNGEVLGWPESVLVKEKAGRWQDRPGSTAPCAVQPLAVKGTASRLSRVAQVGVAMTCASTGSSSDLHLTLVTMTMMSWLSSDGSDEGHQTVVMMMMTCARSCICSTSPWLWLATTSMENSHGGNTCTT